ncbi:MAG: DinB family protein [Longimicrobiales bacterium]
MRTWDETIAQHEKAAAEYLSTAALVTSWDTAPAPGKWSAARITTHLNLAFEAILREIGGGPPMALRTKPLPRFILRHTIMRRLLRGGKFPNGAPAPRETRPPETHADRTVALAEFGRLADEVTVAITAAHRRDPPMKFRHPYFGFVPVNDGLYISARHVQHHCAQLTGR